MVNSKVVAHGDGDRPVLETMFRSMANTAQSIYTIPLVVFIRLLMFECMIHLSHLS